MEGEGSLAACESVLGNCGLAAVWGGDLRQIIADPCCKPDLGRVLRRMHREDRGVIEPAIVPWHDRRAIDAKMFFGASEVAAAMELTYSALSADIPICLTHLYKCVPSSCR